MCIKNPYKIVEIFDRFGFNCVKKYSWFVKTCFTEIEDLHVGLVDGVNVSEVLKNLTHLKVLFSLLLCIYKKRNTYYTCFKLFCYI